MHRWYQLGNVLDAGWLVAYVLLGVAALHPSRPQVREETTDENPGRITHARLTTLALMSFVAPAILAVQALRHEALHVPSIVVAEMAVSLLIIARMAGLASALEAAAFNDHLTGLPNRRLLHDRLRQALMRSERSHDPVAVLFVDLGRFKAVNDKLGHKFGDDVLVELGGRMRSIVRTEDTVARFGGDEFVIVCEGLDVLGVTNVGDRIREALARPIVIGGESVTLSVDVGIAMARPGCNDAEALLAQADLAMYRAKEEARGTEPQVEQVDQPV
jgi:diguanylate cyclase (GGDEF)-like protein